MNLRRRSEREAAETEAQAVADRRAKQRADEADDKRIKEENAKRVQDHYLSQADKKRIADAEAEVARDKENDRITQEQFEADMERRQKERDAKEAADAKGAEEKKGAEEPGAAGASAVGAEEKKVEEEPIGTELTIANLTRMIAKRHKLVYNDYSDADVKAKIKALPGKFIMSSLGDRPPRSAYVDAYVRILMDNPSLIPSDIQPDPELVSLRARLYEMSMADIKKKCIT